MFVVLVSCYVQKNFPFIMNCGNAMFLFTGKLHCLQTFDRSLHMGSSDPTCVQNCRSVPLTVFEILGFKLKKKTTRIIGEMYFLLYLPC